jgi:hypothetical protein
VQTFNTRRGRLDGRGRTYAVWHIPLPIGRRLLSQFSDDDVTTVLA